MAGTLNIVSGDTKGTEMQFQESGLALDITDFVILCRVGTLPTTTILNATVTDGANGAAHIHFGSLGSGSYDAELSVQDSLGIQTSEKFTVNVRNPL